jgi:hypothetical protein
MKKLLLTTAVLTLLVFANTSPTSAQGPKSSSGSTWPGISAGLNSGSANGVTTAPHYEYQYGYDHHSKWRGHWVLVR